MTARHAIKASVVAASGVLALPLILLSWAEYRIGAGETLFTGGGQLVAVVPGPVGVWLRAAYYCATLERCSWETRIGFGSLFTHRGVEVGRFVSTGNYCVIGHAAIGEHVMLASRVSVPSGRHQHSNSSGEHGEATEYARVTIGARTWVGEGAIVMSDVGAACIVAAGAVVVKPVPDGTVVAGNPAQVIKRSKVTPDGTA